MRIINLLSAAMFILLGYFFYLVIEPFFIAAFWAVIMTIVFYPVYKWMLRRVTNNEIAASVITCLSIALFFIVPLAFLSSSLAAELLELNTWAIKNLNDAAPDGFMHRFEFARGALEYVKRHMEFSNDELQNIFVEAVKTAASLSAKGVDLFVRNLFEFIMNMLIAFFMAFYLFIDADIAVKTLKHFLPLTEDEKTMLIERFSDVVTATVTVEIIICLIQGVFIGAAFWVFGVRAPVLWGFVMFILSILPGISSGTVWIPAAAYLALRGEVAYGIMLFLWGNVVILLAEYIVRPKLLSNKTNLHPLLLFLSILGGINEFGIIGVIAGPLLLSLAATALDLYSGRMTKKSAESI